MSQTNYYTTLGVSPSATQAEIKQAYRHLAKQFHPDSQSDRADHEQIVQINAAYEVLGDTQKRQCYDRARWDPNWHSSEFPPEANFSNRRQHRTAEAQRHYHHHQQAKQAHEDQLKLWLQQVYIPVNRILAKILNSLKTQVNHLAADPFDDQLMGDFQTYLAECRSWQETAQSLLRSMPNPPKAARFAANLYYCLNQVGDGIEELERFTTCYDESYLHSGQEMFRIARHMRQEAQAAYGQFF